MVIMISKVAAEHRGGWGGKKQGKENLEKQLQSLSITVCFLGLKEEIS